MSDRQTVGFASLHNHTSKSLLDAVMSAEELVQQAYDFGYDAVAITEHGNMSSLIDGYKKAKELGIKYIAGCEVYETSDIDFKEKDSDRFHLILLAKSDIGLKNLFKIVSEGFTRGFYQKPRVDLNTMAMFSEDVICMSACLGGRLNKSIQSSDGDISEAVQWVNKYKQVFGDNFYIEMQSHKTEQQAYANKMLLKLARETNTKFTVTFDTHIRDSSDFQRDVHRLFIQISQDRSDADKISETYAGCWQQSLDEVHETMDEHIGSDAVDEAIRTTLELANGTSIDIQLHRELMPKIEIPERFSNDIEYLKHLVNKGWIERGFNKFDEEKKQKYKQRLIDEVEILDYLGYGSYFIMLKQLVDKLKQRGIPLGYSRGSGGNVLTLYTIGVTEVDSIKWELDFSRFGNKGRKGSPADYDMDISKERRQESIDVAIELFGKENVAQVATFNSMSPKVCIRDLGKALTEQGVYQISMKDRDSMSKLIPDDPNEHMTIERALESSPELRKYEQLYPLLFEYTKYLQNIPKSVGCHASAVIISPDPVIDYCPLMLNKDGNIMAHLEMHNVMDDIGLTKMDFLGLKTVDVIDNAIKFAGLTWKDIDVNTMDLNDADVYYNIYGSGNTLGIFQMEAFVAQKMFSEMMPNIGINDVFAVNAMNRPAILSVGMDKVYIHNKKNPEDAKYIHPDLEPIFRDTSGIMLYQEQALKVFRLAGFPEDETDIARRAIGKKKKDVMENLFEKFKSGLLKRNWNEEQISELWNLVEAQAGYSFNAGHSTAYGLLSYVTAYLKYHYPVEFMTALLTSEVGEYSETTKYINECKRMGIVVLPPDINESDGKDYTIKDGKILFGLLSVKGVGKNAVAKIMEERKNGLFKDQADFASRCNLDTATNVALIQSGAFGGNRDEMLESFGQSLFEFKTYKPVKTLPSKKEMIDMDIIRSEVEFKNKEVCLMKLNAHKKELYDIKQKTKFLAHMEEFRERYMGVPEMYEFNTLSIFLNSNPFEGIDKQSTGEPYFKPSEEHEDKHNALIGGTISKIKFKKQKNGSRMAYLDLLTQYGMIECIVFGQVYAEYQAYCKKATNIVALAKKSGDQYMVDKIKLLSEWKKEKGITL